MKRAEQQSNPAFKDITNPRVLLRNLDLSKCWDTVSMAEKLTESCMKLGIEPQSCLYSGFNYNFLDKLLKTGNYSKGGKLFCSDFKQLTSAELDSAFYYAQRYDDAGIVAYDPNYLDSHSPQCFYTRPGIEVPKLIKVVFHLKYA